GGASQSGLERGAYPGLIKNTLTQGLCAATHHPFSSFFSSLKKRQSVPFSMIFCGVDLIIPAWTQSLPIRTLAQLHLSFPMLEARQSFVYQDLAEKAGKLERLGMSVGAIARALNVRSLLTTAYDLELVLHHLGQGRSHFKRSTAIACARVIDITRGCL